MAAPATEADPMQKMAAPMQKLAAPMQKMAAPVTRVKEPVASRGAPSFKVGDNACSQAAATAYGTPARTWPVKILAVNGDGTFDVEVENCIPGTFWKSVPISSRSTEDVCEVVPQCASGTDQVDKMDTGMD